MSLSTHLRRGSVRLWFEDNFPGTRSLSTHANRFLCGPKNHPFPSIKPIKDADRALVGTAVDYFVRATLSPTAWDHVTALPGAKILDRTYLTRSTAAVAAVKEIIERARAMRPWQLALKAGQWSELGALCIVLGKFEQCYRSALDIPAIVPKLAPSTRDLNGFLEAFVDYATLKDLEAVAKPAVEDHADLRKSSKLFLNPTFDQSSALGGADADLIADGLLLDWKSAAGRDVVGRLELWQLLGYVLADTSDTYGIESVGISAVRWRQRLVLPVDTLVRELSGQVGLELERLRDDFATVLQQGRRTRSQRVPVTPPL